MPLEIICAENKELFEALEKLTRLTQIFKAANLDFSSLSDAKYSCHQKIVVNLDAYFNAKPLNMTPYIVARKTKRPMIKL